MLTYTFSFYYLLINLQGAEENTGVGLGQLGNSSTGSGV